MPPNQTESSEPDSGQLKQHHRVSFDLRILSLLLLAVIAGMLLLWRPWTAKLTDRTVQVSGDSTIKAEPDEYVFYPTYEFKNSNQKSALAALSKKSDLLVAGLKKLGVADSAIKTNADGYDNGTYLPIRSDSITTYTLRLTITLSDRKLSQKVQDYLVTTTPSGQISPTVNFSEAKRKQLESQARDAAEKDARAKAEQSANNLGFKLSKVKAISEGSGFGPVQPLVGVEGKAVSGTDQASPQLAVQPGENELHYSISVTYYIK